MLRGEGRKQYSARGPSRVQPLVGIETTNSVASAPLGPRESIATSLSCYARCKEAFEERGFRR
jgi:hypothetical protein